MTNTNLTSSDDIIKGRIIAMRSMIAQFSNEIEQLEDVLKDRKSKPHVAALPIPEGFIRHDGGTCPVDKNKIESVFAVCSWNTGNILPCETCRQSIINDNDYWERRVIQSDNFIIAYKLKKETP